MKCPRCHYDNPQDTSFCGKCGTQIQAPSVEIPLSPTAAPKRPPAALAKGTTFGGKYKIIEEIGRGGMGVVYKAKDLHLDRFAALKILPPERVADPDRKRRFVQEAKAASALNHPNIITVYDIDQEGGMDFIAMEYVPGQTLADLIGRRGLKLNETLKVGTQIADALGAAHAAGIVHRDLKPGNVMVTESGLVKVLDFGLAKLTEPAGGGDEFADTRTLRPQTEVGTIVGTVSYMSPEQLEGKKADARSDIFAFGVILYEMATGRRAFEGKSPASVIAAILGADPPGITTVQPAAPPALDRLVKRCLAKDPDKRWQSIRDVMLELSDFAAEPLARPRASPLWRSLFWAMAALSLVIVAAGIYFSHRASIEQPAVELTLLAPEKTTFDSIAVSPDGSRLAFTATDSSGKTQIWVRSLSSLSAQPLNGTEGAMSPFWSPDSRFIAFFADGRLKRIEATGGPLQTLADAADPALGALGGAWNRDGVILFPRTHADPIYRVSIAGGEGVPTTAIDTSRREHGHQWPQFLPDGRHFIYYAWGDKAELEGMRVGSLDPKEPTRILPIYRRATYAEGPDGSGYLLFIRDQTLLAQPFDAKRLELSGEPISVIQPAGAFTVSQNGVLVFDPSGLGANTQLTWFDRAGKRLGTVGPSSSQSCPVLSPDEKHVAVSRDEVWIYELASGIGSRLTFNGGGIPLWSPDSARVVFAADTDDGIWKLYQKLSTGAGEEELLHKTSSLEIWPVGWSRDGRFLLYGETDPKTHWDLWVLANPLGQPAERKSILFLKTEFIEDFGQFSPDGKWIAYHSTESGRDEIYVRPFRPDNAGALGTDGGPSGGKWQVSRGGGVEPRWRADGKELFYYGIDGTMMAVPVKTGDVFEPGTPEPLFWVRAQGYLRYDVTADGQRFLINTPSGEGASALSVILNWTARLRR